MGPQSDWFEPETGVVTLQGQKSPFPLFDAPPRSSSFVDDETDYVPDDRDPDSLPPFCRCGKLCDMLTSKMTSMPTWAKPWPPRRSSRPARLKSGPFKFMFRVLGIIWLL
jgi:hypothetical protein